MAFASIDCKEGPLQLYRRLKFVFKDILRLTQYIQTHFVSNLKICFILQRLSENKSLIYLVLINLICQNA